MPATLTGHNGYVRTSINTEFIQGQGWIVSEVFRGTKSAIVGLAGNLILDGYEFDITNDGPFYIMSARKQTQDSNDQAFTDRFTIRKEPVTKSIWSLDKVDQEMAKYVTNGGTEADYKKFIEEAIDSEDPEAELILDLNLPRATYPNAYNVAVELNRGATDYEDEYTVLARDRVVGLNYSAYSVPLKSKSVVYPTADLLSTFNIPTFIQISLPETPLITPSNAQWGWRVRRQEVEYHHGNTAHIIEDWVYAAWSKNIYDTSLFGNPYPNTA